MSVVGGDLDSVGTHQNRLARMRQALNENNRAIAELKGRLKEREMVFHELRALIKDLQATGPAPSTT